MSFRTLQISLWIYGAVNLLESYDYQASKQKQKVSNRKSESDFWLIWNYLIRLIASGWIDLVAEMLKFRTFSFDTLDTFLRLCQQSNGMKESNVDFLGCWKWLWFVSWKMSLKSSSSMFSSKLFGIESMFCRSLIVTFRKRWNRKAIQLLRTRINGLNRR